MCDGAAFICTFWRTVSFIEYLICSDKYTLIFILDDIFIVFITFIRACQLWSCDVTIKNRMSAVFPLSSP